MSDSLKIMVREAKAERRALTREEAYAIEAEYTRHRVSKDAHSFLTSQGMLRHTYLSAVKASQWGQYGSAEFWHAEVREATPAERAAWHAQQIGCSLVLLVGGRYQTRDEILQDKEIVLEVVRGDAHDD